MTMFEDRERGYEAKWAHDEETQFRVMAWRDAALGEWAAGLMKLSGAEAADYVQSVIHAGLARKGVDPALEKVRADLSARGAACPEADLFEKARSLLEQAKARVLAEPKPRQ
jgi:hypothetical protein